MFTSFFFNQNNNVLIFLKKKNALTNPYRSYLGRDLKLYFKPIRFNHAIFVLFPGDPKKRQIIAYT
jgi:hypothetical protein